MRAMWIGFGLAIVIAVAAGVIVQELGPSSAQRYSTSNTRL